MEPVALVTADWHLRKYDCIWPRHPTLIGDVEWGITQIKQLVEGMPSISDILLLGDLFDAPLQQSQAATLMREFLDWACERNVGVRYVQGQHECTTPPWLQALHRWPTWLHQQTVEIAGMRVYGLDYQHPRDVREALENIPADATVLATHQVWKDFLTEDSGDAWFAWVPAHVRTILTGDYHRHYMLTKKGGRRIVSPGPLAAQKIDEPTNLGVWILHDDGTFQDAPLRPRQIFRHSISSEDDLQRFIAAWPTSDPAQPQSGVPDNIATNIIRIHYLSTVPNVRAQIRDTIGDSAHIFWQPEIVVTAPEEISEQECILAVLERGVEGCLRDYYGEVPIVRDTAIRLWRADDVTHAIDEIIKEQMNAEVLNAGPGG